MSTDIQLSYEELVAKVQSLENLIQIMKEEKDNEELLKFPWIGNLGSWYWLVTENKVFFNPQKARVLGFSKEETPESAGFEFFTERLHPEDYERVMNNMRKHLYGQSPAYEVTYRIQAKNGEWKWFYDRGKVTKRSEAGKPEIVAGIVFDITEQKRMEDLLKNQNKMLAEIANTDYLTQVNNRKSLLEKLNYEVRRINRTHDPLSILIIDIDHFKEINDTYGHLVGDRVLIEVAQILKESIRNTDIIGRYGGEEFLIVFPKCNLAGAVKVAEKIRYNVQTATHPKNIQVTVSGGVQEYKDETIDELINLADQNMYLAKEKGRNQIIPVISE